MNFGRYTPPDAAPLPGITLDELLAIAKDDQSLFARAENSGCEGCHVEVARWNYTAERFERFAVEKLFGGELPDHPDMNARDSAKLIADQINKASSSQRS